MVEGKVKFEQVCGGMVDVEEDNILLLMGIFSNRNKTISSVPLPPNTPLTVYTHTYVHNTPSPVVGGGGAVVVSPITSATDRPRMKYEHT